MCSRSFLAITIYLFGCSSGTLVSQTQNFHLLPNALDALWTKQAQKTPSPHIKESVLRATAKTTYGTLSIISPLGLVFVPKACLEAHLKLMKISKKGFAARKTTEEIKIPDLEVYLLKSAQFKKKNSTLLATSYDTIRDVRLSLVTKTSFAKELQFCLLRLYKDNTPLRTKDYLSIAFQFQNKASYHALVSYPKQKYLIPPLSKNHLAQKSIGVALIEKLIKKHALPISKDSAQFKLTEIKKGKKQAEKQLEVAKRIIDETAPKTNGIISQAKNLITKHQTSEFQNIFCQHLLQRSAHPFLKSLLEMSSFYESYISLEENDEDQLEEKLSSKRQLLLKKHLQVLKNVDAKTLKGYLKIMLHFQKAKLNNFMIRAGNLEDDFEDHKGATSSFISDLLDDSGTLVSTTFAKYFSESTEEAWELLEEDALFQLIYQTKLYWNGKILPQHRNFTSNAASLEKQYFSQLKIKEKNYTYSPKANHDPRINLIKFDPRKVSSAEKKLPKQLKENRGIWNTKNKEAFSISNEKWGKYIPAISKTTLQMGSGMLGGILLNERQHIVGWFMTQDKNPKGIVLFPHIVLFYTEKIAQANYIKDEVHIIDH